MAKSWKEWEKPILELEEGIDKLEQLIAVERDVEKKASLALRAQEYREKLHKFIDVRYSRLGPWEKVLVARAETRPYTLDIINAVFDEFVELDGDRRIGTDHAVVAGPASLEGRPVMVVGQQKGRNIQERGYRNFAMAKPEGYRKAIRMFEMAERFRMPVVTIVDTPAADPGVESESRGISEAIAASMLSMFSLTVPIVSVIIGEGGSGGAIGIAAANRVLMLEHSVYSVIPPEGCAAILWRDPAKGPQAAAALKLTAQSAHELGLVEEVIPEPFGGAHRDPGETADRIKEAMLRHLAEVAMSSPEAIKQARYDRFRILGRFSGQ
ncbi:MAG: acetyl-CoA carboxylase carboxyltransferase subunit alpha [Armatimonadetes bacterium]|nr:acetyl-CoA carboxylase carboxyltransferase subunit alpha [Armatimonadota bacterium]